VDRQNRMNMGASIPLTQGGNMRSVVQTGQSKTFDKLKANVSGDCQRLRKVGTKPLYHLFPAQGALLVSASNSNSSARGRQVLRMS